MTLKTPSPWTAGRKIPAPPASKVMCVGGRCTWTVSWSGGERLRKTVDRLKSLRKK